ncbi:hypothetical protein C7378_3503 [Acidipila rosea]|uniref:3-keto-disaccharide hydrolase domain-containing protein n=2 Tax=Acidipila rosea TaxID=768535 RepID=A0A4R1KWS6_9BACT|nr:hypothetical protein C7378_3503 [Acidipila rosea]
MWRVILSFLIAGTSMTVTADSLHAAGLRDSDRTYPMDRTHWQMSPPIGWAGRVEGVATFARDEGIPTGTMKLNEGVATLSEGTFAQGQIDLDIKPLGYNDAGIIFRRRGDDDGEFVYVRANPDCPAAQDCVQYAPVTHGLMGWNIYPNYQASAPINATGWNHLTIRVAGDRMQVFVNHAAEPVLTVARLLGLTSQGGIALKGPAVYANLIVQSGPPVMVAAAAPAAAPGLLTNWLAAPPTANPTPLTVSIADVPPDGAWQSIAVEPTGLVNLGRTFGAAHAPSVSVGWLKAVIDSSAPRRAFLHAGFAMQVVVFVNGQPVYRGNNPYYPEEARLSPGGRIGFDNALIPIDLKRGHNEIVLAVGNDWRADPPERHPSHYGWAAEARIDDDPSNPGS